jgi:hypothetical protein
MPFQARIIADSTQHIGKRIVTFELEYPRWIHGEVMTHRVFSRNAMSSRAVPVAKMIEQVRNSPAMPVFWGKNQPGMQAAEELQGVDRVAVIAAWQAAAEQAANTAEHLANSGLHKQLANRVLEPFQWMRTIVTATEWDNFYALRDHEDAQPEFRHLARMMCSAMEHSTPKLLQVGEWHLPYIREGETFDADTAFQACMVSAARCARVSYLTHDGEVPSITADLALFRRLAGGRPMHASPLEHQATPGQSTRNFIGWQQFRHVWGAVL